jgi:hypothetical protein
MKAHYLNIPQNTSLKDWYKRWFYVQMEVGDTPTPCDVALVPEQQDSWSEVPRAADMEQVRELLGLINKGSLTDHSWPPIICTGGCSRAKTECIRCSSTRAVLDPQRST